MRMPCDEGAKLLQPRFFFRPLPGLAGSRLSGQFDMKLRLFPVFFKCGYISDGGFVFL